jgi:hypothetical protein
MGLPSIGHRDDGLRRREFASGRSEWIFPRWFSGTTTGLAHIYVPSVILGSFYSCWKLVFAEQRMDGVKVLQQQAGKSN